MTNYYSLLRFVSALLADKHVQCWMEVMDRASWLADLSDGSHLKSFLFLGARKAVVTYPILYLLFYFLFFFFKVHRNLFHLYIVVACEGCSIFVPLGVEAGRCGRGFQAVVCHAYIYTQSRNCVDTFPVGTGSPAGVIVWQWFSIIRYHVFWCSVGFQRTDPLCSEDCASCSPGWNSRFLDSWLLPYFVLKETCYHR